MKNDAVSFIVIRLPGTTVSIQRTDEQAGNEAFVKQQLEAVGLRQNRVQAICDAITYDFCGVKSCDGASGTVGDFEYELRVTSQPDSIHGLEGQLPQSLVQPPTHTSLQPSPMDLPPASGTEVWIAAMDSDHDTLLDLFGDRVSPRANAKVRIDFGYDVCSLEVALAEVSDGFQVIVGVPIDKRGTHECGMRHAVVGNLGEVRLASGGFNSCRPLVFVNRNSGDAVLYHYPADDLQPGRDGSLSEEGADRLNQCIEAIGATDVLVIRGRDPLAEGDSPYAWKHGSVLAFQAQEKYDELVLVEFLQDRGLRTFAISDRLSSCDVTLGGDGGLLVRHGDTSRDTGAEGNLF